MNSETRNCQNCKNEFTIDSDDFVFYGKMNVPAPTFCPDCRRQRRLAWFNLVNLFHRNCDLCQTRFISMYPPEADYVVYCPKCWWSDKWDWRDYGRDYDFSRPFFEQFNELMHQVPLLGLSINVNTTPGSPYNNHCADLKDCYLTFNSDFSQECAYGVNVTRNREVLDCSMVMDCDACYDCMCLYKSNKTIGCRGNNRFCIDSAFLRDCENCTDCFMCANLKNKQYCFKNQQLTKEEYQKIRQSYNLGSWVVYNNAKEEAEEFWKTIPPKPTWDTLSVNCTGSYMFECKNCYECYDVANCEDCKYVMSLWRAPQKNCYDISGFGYAIENCYEAGVAGEFASNLRFTQESGIHLMDAEYCKLALGGKNQFGCISARKGENVIFNKQYSKKEFKELREKIIEHMNNVPFLDKKGNTYEYGEFFPMELSPFPYNITFANLFDIKEKEEILSLGLKYQDKEDREYEITLPSGKIPNTIEDISESILRETIGCSNCDKGFKLIELEFSFLKKMNLPIPRQCPFCRIHEKLTIWVDNMTLKDRICMNCNTQFRTHYDENRAPNILCKECYKKEYL